MKVSATQEVMYHLSIALSQEEAERLIKESKVLLQEVKGKPTYPKTIAELTNLIISEIGLSVVGDA